MFDATEISQAPPELTDRQQAVLEVIRSHAGQHGYPPTVREIGSALGLASSSTVHSHLAALEKAGIIERDPTKPRALRWGARAGVDFPEGTPISGGDSGERHDVTPDGVDIEPSIAIPVVGQVAAGAPALAAEQIEQYFPVPQQLTQRGGDSFLLKIRGDSMINAGILDGDYVVVKQQPTARDGDIVIALVDGDDEATCKRFARVGDHIVLQPENDRLEPIVSSEVTVVGLVTGVMRAL